MMKNNMYVNALKEVFFLIRFKAAIIQGNLQKAAVHLDKQKKASDAVEQALKDAMKEAKESIDKQKALMDNLIDRM